MASCVIGTSCRLRRRSAIHARNFSTHLGWLADEHIMQAAREVGHPCRELLCPPGMAS